MTNRAFVLLILVIAWILYFVNQQQAECSEYRQFTVNGKLVAGECSKVAGKEICLIVEDKQ